MIRVGKTDQVRVRVQRLVSQNIKSDGFRILSPLDDSRIRESKLESEFSNFLSPMTLTRAHDFESEILSLSDLDSDSRIFTL